ncbi:MAG TPA: glutamyl-tRNA reductase [Gemmatimonadales bacterium]|nr:glutamyl-tRNA reductase [Gemmatimonadales bacterium]
MPIICVGTSHNTAPVALRERLALDKSRQRDLLTSLSSEALEAGFGELAVLSTCNRTELYAASAGPAVRPESAPSRLTGLLADWSGVPLAELGSHFSAWLGTDAVRHLCRVAAGLDSMIIGESEILGQVSEAHELASQVSTVGPVLDNAFHTAVRAGRRARSETAIGRHTASVSMEAVRQIARLRGELSTAQVLVVGTGQAGRLAGEALRELGVRHLSVVSRTAEHAEALAAALGARPLPWHCLEAAIRGSDVVISCTGAPHAVITRELVVSAMRERGDRAPLLLADIAVPRDVEPSVRQLRGVTLLDMDDLHEAVAGNLELRRREVPKVEAIVEQEVARFESWKRAAALRPILSAMRERGEAIRRGEVEKTLRRLGPVAPLVAEEVEALAHSLVNKLLHAPTSRLRRETDPERIAAYSRAAVELFSLEAGSMPALDTEDADAVA